MILVAGSANLDFVVQAPHIPQPGETVMGGRFQTFPGGKGANQAVACARAGGASTHMLLALGADAYALPLEASLQAAQVQLHTVRVLDQSSGCAFICVSNDGENAITVAPGANACLAPKHLPALAGFSHLLLQLEIPLATVVAYAQAARRQGVAVVLNAAPAQALPPDLLPLLDVLVVNQGELAQVSGHDGSICECLRRLDVTTVVVTLGHHGCCVRHHGRFFLQPAYAVQTVDTTGAGDTFCGTLVAALGHGSDLSEALRQASAAGALACTRLGAQSSIPQAHEVATFCAQQAVPSAAQIDALRRYCGLSESDAA